jgi:hypothetical protein
MVLIQVMARDSNPAAARSAACSPPADQNRRRPRQRRHGLPERDGRRDGEQQRDEERRRPRVERAAKPRRDGIASAQPEERPAAAARKSSIGNMKKATIWRNDPASASALAKTARPPCRAPGATALVAADEPERAARRPPPSPGTCAAPSGGGRALPAAETTIAAGEQAGPREPSSASPARLAKAAGSVASAAGRGRGRRASSRRTRAPSPPRPAPARAPRCAAGRACGRRRAPPPRIRRTSRRRRPARSRSPRRAGARRAGAARDGDELPAAGAGGERQGHERGDRRQLEDRQRRVEPRAGAQSEHGRQRERPDRARARSTASPGPTATGSQRTRRARGERGGDARVRARAGTASRTAPRRPRPTPGGCTRTGRRPPGRRAASSPNVKAPHRTRTDTPIQSASTQRGDATVPRISAG